MNLRDKLKQFEKSDTSDKHRKKEVVEYKNINNFDNEEVSNSQGTYLKTNQKYPLEYKHGLYKIEKFFYNIDSNILQTIANTELKNDIENIKDNILFIDTETTGLMGGTGTVAFLIGVGYFNNNKLTIEQHIMRDYDEEPAMLKNIKELLDKKDILVSFNGKSFDLPLIKTRLILNRYKYTNHKLHLDLLHSARRIWSFLDSCSLESLENNVLDFERKDDIPGSMIPGVYFNFIEKKDYKLLAPVVEHNIYDILSLITLFTHLKEVHLNNVDNLSPHELYQLGRLKEKEKDFHSCINHLEKSVDKSDESEIRHRALKKLSWQYKRISRYKKALEIWNLLIRKGKLGIFPYIEKAKYLEHHLKEYNDALDNTEKAIELLVANKVIISNYQEKLSNLEHRKNRLIKKINN